MRLYADGKEISRMSIKQDLVKYKIGFYSNYGNTIISSNIFEYRPMPWFTNVENSNGGRVSFKRDTIIFENGDMPKIDTILITGDVINNVRDLEDKNYRKNISSS